MEQCRLHLVTCFWRNHVLVACFVTMNCDFISWEFHETFAIITCAGLNFELAVWSRESQFIWWGRGAGGHGWCFVISFVVVVVQHTPPPHRPPSPRDTFNQWLSSEVVFLPLSQWSAMSRAETPNCKIFIKILELLCILTKPKLKKKKKLAHTCCLVKMRDTYTLTFCSVCFIEILWYIL